MKWFIALCVVASVSAVACGGGKTAGNAAGITAPAATVAGADTPQAPAGPGDAQLADALLTVGDLPTGWSNIVDAPSTTSSTLCNVNLDKAMVANATGKALRSFTKGGALGPFFAEVLVTLPGSDASNDFRTIRDGLKACNQWTEPNSSSDGTPTAYSGGELSFPAMGDESIAFRATSDATFLGSVRIDFAFVRHGHSLLFVAYAGVGFTPLDVDQFVALTRRADDKVRSHGIR